MPGQPLGVIPVSRALALLATAPQNLVPQSPDSRLEARQALVVAGHGMVVRPAADDGTQPMPLHRDQLVHALLQLLFDALQGRAEPFADALSSDGERSVAPSLRAVMREAKEGERFRPAESLLFSVGCREAAKLDQPGFLGMQFEAKLFQPCLEVSEESLSFTARLEPQHEIVCVADDDHIAACVTLSPLLNPQVENVVQVDVR